MWVLFEKELDAECGVVTLNLLHASRLMSFCDLWKGEDNGDVLHVLFLRRIPDDGLSVIVISIFIVIGVAEGVHIQLPSLPLEEHER